MAGCPRHPPTRHALLSLNFPHEIAVKARRDSAALVAVSGEEAALLIALVKSVQRTSTLESRVVFDLVQTIRPESLLALLSCITEPTLRAPAVRLAENPDPLVAISSTLAGRLLAHLAGDPENGPALQRILAQIEKPSRYTNARALQQDAVNLALKAFGVQEGAAEIQLTGAHSALGTIRLHEDAVIEHDARWNPGWQLKECDLTGHAVFKSYDERLDIYTANKRPLEQLLGVDLIYLNQRCGALVMVQYKMMEPEG